MDRLMRLLDSGGGDGQAICATDRLSNDALEMHRSAAFRIYHFINLLPDVCVYGDLQAENLFIFL